MNDFWLYTMTLLVVCGAIAFIGWLAGDDDLPPPHGGAA